LLSIYTKDAKGTSFSPLEGVYGAGAKQGWYRWLNGVLKKVPESGESHTVDSVHWRGNSSSDWPCEQTQQIHYWSGENPCWTDNTHTQNDLRLMVWAVCGMIELLVCMSLMKISWVWCIWIC
jgi:hypothetical protein